MPACSGKTLKIADTSAQDVQLEPARHRNRGLIGGTAVLAVLVVAWLIVPAVNRWASATVTVSADRLRVATVVRGDLVRDVTVQGRVVAAVSPTLYASAPGTITLAVEAGASVTEGEVLATIASPALTSELEQARATLEQLSVQLERQRIESRQQAPASGRNSFARALLPTRPRRLWRSPTRKPLPMTGKPSCSGCIAAMRNTNWV